MSAVGQRVGRVYQAEVFAGRLEETPKGYRFTYDADYLHGPNPPVSLTLPKNRRVHESEVLFPFFVSLLAEGSLATMQCRVLRLDEADLFGRVMSTMSGDVIGSVSIVPEVE